MPAFVVTAELDADLDLLFQTEPDEVSAAELLLELLYEDESILDSVRPPQTVHQHIPTFEFKLFETAHQHGLNVYILKYWDPEYGHLCKHRILVGYHPQRDTYYALTAPERGLAYHVGSAEFAELVRRYELYGIPTLLGSRVR